MNRRKEKKDDPVSSSSSAVQVDNSMASSSNSFEEDRQHLLSPSMDTPVATVSAEVGITDSSIDDRTSSHYDVVRTLPTHDITYQQSPSMTSKNLLREFEQLGKVCIICIPVVMKPTS